MTQRSRTFTRLTLFAPALLVGAMVTVANATAQPLKPIMLPAPLAANHARETAAILRNDASGIRSTYTADAIMRGASVRDLTPRDSIEAWFATHYASYKYSAFAYQPQEYIAMGDYAYETGLVNMARRMAADTADRKSAFRYFYLWKKMPDGSWLIHRVMNVGNVVPQPAPASPTGTGTQSGAEGTLRVAILPFTVQTRDASLAALPSRIEQAAAAKAAAVKGAELVRASSVAGVSATDPVATVASRARASIVVRGTISATGAEVKLDASAIDAASGKVIHQLPSERGTVQDPGPAVERLASRIAEMLAMHVDRDQTNPQLYSVPSIESHRLIKQADSLFSQGRPAQALPLVYQAYQVDTMNVRPLFLAVAIHNNAGRRAQGDSLLDVVQARSDRLTEIEKLNIAWFRGTPHEAFVAARAAAAMDRPGWSYAVGLRANAAGYYMDAAEALSRRAEIAAQGGYSAQTWAPWRGQYLTALHATGDFARELSEIKLARAELANATDATYRAEEMRALAALGRVAEVRALVARQLARPADSANVLQLQFTGLELKRHGHVADGDRIIAEVGDFAAAHASALDSLTFATAIGLARKYDDALPRLEKLANGSTNYVRVGRYGGIAALAGRRDIAAQVMTRLAQMGDGAPSHLWQGYVAAAGGNCQAAVSHFQMALQKGQGFGAPGWWHNDPATVPIWGCDAFEKLAPMKAK